MLREPVDAIDAMLQLDHPVKLAAKEWADETLPSMAGRDERGHVSRETWRQAGEFGLLGVYCPTSHGGSDLGSVHTSLIYEGLGSSKADNGVIFALASQALAANKTVAMAGSPEQLDQWMPGLIDGSYFASFAMTEVESGSDPWSIQTTAEEQSDGSWVLNGEKIWATLAPLADVSIVFAKTDPNRGQWGISAFLVDATTEGFVRGEPILKMGMPSCPFGRLTFNDCRLPASSLLGQKGSGAAIFIRVVEAERALLYSSQIGSIERVIDASTSRARSRHQGDTHIGSHQAVAHRIVDMKLRHETARLLLYKAAALSDAGQSVTLAAALTKLQAADGSIATTIDAMKTFGALGYTLDGGMEAELRDACAGLAFSGTVDTARNVIGSFLGLNRPE